MNQFQKVRQNVALYLEPEIISNSETVLHSKNEYGFLIITTYDFSIDHQRVTGMTGVLIGVKMAISQALTLTLIPKVLLAEGPLVLLKFRHENLMIGHGKIGVINQSKT